MLSKLVQQFHRATPEILTPEQLVGSIDFCLKEHKVAMDALSKVRAGEITEDAFELLYDLADMTRQSVIKRLVDNGLWDDPKKIPSTDDFLDIRNNLDPEFSELNPDQLGDNVVELDEHREHRD